MAGLGKRIPVGGFIRYGDTTRTYEVGLVTFAKLAQVFHLLVGIRRSSEFEFWTT